MVDVKMNSVCPLVTVVVPVFNVAAYLKTCLQSLINQTYSRIEIIIVDDGSTDESSSICDAFVKREKRARVIHQKNSGLGAARNVGVQSASGEWIMFLDSDDYLSPFAVEICIRAQQSSGADHIVFPFFYVTEDGTMLGVERKGCKNGYIEKSVYSRQAIDCLPFHVACTKLYRREAVRQVAFSQGVHEDVDYSHRLLRYVEHIYAVDTPLYFYRQRATGLSKKVGIERERNHFYSIAWVKVLECSAEAGFFETVLSAWECLKSRLNLANEFLDDKIYEDVLLSFSKWFRMYRKQLKRFPANSYIEMKDASKRSVSYYSSGFRVSWLSRRALFAARLLRWLKRKIKRIFARLKASKSERAFIKSVGRGGEICVVLPTPHHDNLGDQMIAEAMVRFYRANGYLTSEVPMDLWKGHRELVVKSIPENALIAVIGGGNIGTLWEDANQDILDVISSFPNNRIVVFPETAFFAQDQHGKDLFKKDVDVFRSHRNLTICFRDRASFKMFNGIAGLDCRYLPDSVLFGYPPRKPATQKSNIVLVCFRSDKEAVLSEDAKTEITRQLLEKGYLPQTISMHCGQRLSFETRNAVIAAQLDMFSSASLLVCDTLHGMLFAWLAGTECVCFDNVSKKVSGVHEWIKDYPWIHLHDGASSLALPKLGVPVSRQDVNSFIKFAKENLV